MAKSTVIQYVPVNSTKYSPSSRFYFTYKIVYHTNLTGSVRLQHLIYILCSIYPMYQHLNTGFLMLPFQDKNSASKNVFFPSGTPLTPKRWKIPNDFVKIPVHLFSVRFLKIFLGCIHPCCSCLDLGCLVPPQSQQSQHHGWKTQT